MIWGTLNFSMKAGHIFVLFIMIAFSCMKKYIIEMKGSDMMSGHGDYGTDYNDGNEEYGDYNYYEDIKDYDDYEEYEDYSDYADYVDDSGRYKV